MFSAANAAATTNVSSSGLIHSYSPHHFSTHGTGHSDLLNSYKQQSDLSQVHRQSSISGGICS